MKNSLFALGILTMLTSCNNKNETRDESLPKPDRKQQPAHASTEECYRWTMKNDTVAMRFVRTADNVRGQLQYLWYEKDKSNGTFVGVFKRDTLRANFKFQSEGMESLREIVFVKKGSQLIQADGEMADKNGKMIFTGELSLNDMIILNPVNCD